MANDDTLNLLQNCNLGIQMAIYSINEVLDKVTDSELKQILTVSKSAHEALGDKIPALLTEYNEAVKEPTPIAKGMSWMKTNAKLTFEESDQTIVDLIIDGCNMGIKSLYRDQNQYSTANDKAKNLATELIRLEESLRQDIGRYL